MSWSLESLEFVVRWEAVTTDDYPSPMTFRSEIPALHDYERAKIEIRERIQSIVDPALDRAFATLARPEVRVAACTQDRRDPENAAGCVRVLAVRGGERGYLVTQQMGRTCWHSAGFTIVEQDPAELASSIVAALPHVEPGTLDDVELLGREDLDYTFASYTDADTYGAATQTLAARSADFLTLPVATFGAIEIATGPADPGGRRTLGRINWRDLVDDGRYLMLDDPRPLATAATDERLLARIEGCLKPLIPVASRSSLVDYDW